LKKRTMQSINQMMISTPLMILIPRKRPSVPPEKQSAFYP